MIGKIAIALTLLAILPIKACQDNNLTTQEDFKYQSFNVGLEREFFQANFYQNHKSTEKITLTGQLYIPKDAQQPMPAVIFQHGSGGLTPLKDWYREITAELTANHIAVLIADSHSARGLGSTANDQTALSSATRLLDTAQALKKLANDPRINPNKIAIAGDSYGGFLAMRFAETEIIQALNPNGEKFASHAMLYPACNAIPRQPKLNQTPLLFLLGESDNYTNPNDCLNYINQLKAQNHNIKLHTFPQAYHGFLYNIPPVYFAKAQTFNQCKIILEKNGEMTLPDYQISSENLNLKQFYDKVIKSNCIKLGAHVGGSKQARKQSLNILTQFLKNNLITPNAYSQ